MNKLPLDDLSKEELIRAIYGADINKIALERIWQEKLAEKNEQKKPSKETMKSRWDTFKRINKAVSFPKLASMLVTFFPLLVLGFCFLVLNARNASNKLLDVNLVTFVVIFIFAILNAYYASEADSRANKINSKLTALIALLSKSNIINE